MRELLRALLATSGALDPIDAAWAALTTLLAGAPVGMAFFDRALCVAAANPAFAALVNTPPGASLDRLAIEDFAGGAELAVLAAEVRDTGIARSCERWGHRFVHCYPIGPPGGVTGVGCIVEPDRSRQAEVAAAGLEDGLLEAVLHELRAPLATVLVWNSALYASPSDAPLRERAHEAIRQSVLAQTRLLDELADLASARRGTLQLNVQAVAVKDELVAAIERVRPAASKKSLGLEVRCEQDVGVLEGDRDRLRQLLEQLLSNAVKFTDPGGRVIVTARRSPEVVELAMTVAGVGIRPEWVAHLFEPSRASEGAAQRSGLSVDLAAARAIVEAHGGTLRVESDGEGRGTTFVITLPHTRPERTRSAASVAPSL
jgi:signal transduction histidine kinase